MTRFYEFVSLYHPDRLCDYLVSCLLDVCIKQDKYIDFRVECLVQNNEFIFSGNINTNYEWSKIDLDYVIKKILDECNINGTFINNISFSKKSLKERHFNGTGIYYGLAINHVLYLPSDYIIAKQCSDYFQARYEKDYYKSTYLFNDDELVMNVTFTNKINNTQSIINIPARVNISYKDGKLLGLTGRKLGIDYYNSLIPNNGGSPWGKDPYNTDLTFNLYARELAKNYIKNNKEFNYIKVILLYLGKNDGIAKFYDERNTLLDMLKITDLTPDLVEKMRLNRPIYKDLCRNGLFFSKI